MLKLLYETVSFHLTSIHILYNCEGPLGLLMMSQRFLAGTQAYRDHVTDLMQKMKGED